MSNLVTVNLTVTVCGKQRRVTATGWAEMSEDGDVQEVEYDVVFADTDKNVFPLNTHPVWSAEEEKADKEIDAAIVEATAMKMFARPEYDLAGPDYRQRACSLACLPGCVCRDDSRDSDYPQSMIMWLL